MGYEMNAKEFKAYIIERDGSHKVTFQSALFQWHSANTLSEGQVSPEVLEKVLREVIKKENGKRLDGKRLPKNTKTRNA